MGDITLTYFVLFTFMLVKREYREKSKRNIAWDSWFVWSMIACIEHASINLLVALSIGFNDGAQEFQFTPWKIAGTRNVTIDVLQI